MPKQSVLTSALAYAMIRATEAAAIATEALVGSGDEQAADQAAIGAMREALNFIDMDGCILIGEGEKDEAPALHVGERLGTGAGPAVDIALDPLEGATLVAKSASNALCVMAAAPRGGLLQTPNIYMEKLAIGPGFAHDVVDLDASPGENAERLAQAKGVRVKDICVCVLDRPRHDKIIAELRKAGVRIKLIADGDVAGVIYTAYPDMGVDMYLGEGGAPEGVLAAAALKCVGGQMQTRLSYRNDGDRIRAERAGVKELNRLYRLDDLVSSEAIFVATGVTKGGLLDGVKRAGGKVHTQSLLMTSFDGAVRTIRSATPLR
jgi:fructose-1,6-bisphosphatase II / sedoheptulose-1,7-bisphosphatase